MKFFLAESLKNGELPLWCSSYYSGAPFLSDIQSGVFYPLSILFLLLPFAKAFNYYILLHLFLAFCFFYFFIRTLGLSRRSALFTSISYCYGSYTIATINTLNNLSTLIWLPAILCSLNMAAKDRKPSAYFIAILFICSSILGGEPQLTTFISVLILFYAFIVIPENRAPLKDRVRHSGIVLLLIFSACMIVFVQLGSTYIDYKNSARLGGLNFTDATYYSLSTDSLKHFIIPLVFQPDFATSIEGLKSTFPLQDKIPWLLTVYPGFLIVPLAIVGLFFNFSKKNLFWLFAFTITLLLALGDKTPLYLAYFKLFPFFRFPVKFIAISSFSLLVLAAYGFEYLTSRMNSDKNKQYLLFSLLCMILIADLYIAHRHINPLCKTAFYYSHHPDLKPVFEDHSLFRIYRDPQSRDKSDVPVVINDQHIKWQMTMAPHLGVLQGINHVEGNTGLELLYQYLMTEILQKPWKEKIRFLELANVKYIISSQNLEEIPELKEHIERVNPHVFRIRKAMPRAWIVGQMLPIKTGNVNELLSGHFMPATSALTGAGRIGGHVTPFFKEVDRIKYLKGGSIEIDVTADRPGVLYLAESSYTGWDIFVDGRKKEGMFLNFFFQGVAIEPGSHRINFVYRSQHFNTFLAISLVSLLLFIAFWIISLRSQFSHPVKKP